MMIMETLKLNETEQQYFGELFYAFDTENVGKISKANAYDLFTAAYLPADVLNQITDLCGAKRLGYFGRSQFYVALKLIAAAQIGLPLRADSLNAGVDIPLPKFARINEPDKRRLNQQSQQQHAMSSTNVILDHDLIQLQERQGGQVVNQLPPPPAKIRGNSLPRPTSLFTETDLPAQYNQQQMLCVSDDSGDSSPTEVPTPVPLTSAFASTTPTNALNSSQGHTDKSWAFFQKLNEMPGGPQLWDHCDEDRQLLGTEEESSDRHSSDEEIDIWTITNEQREYYTNQFKSMQPDLNGLLSGTVAKDFFEKSKLPVKELSVIWQLSDVNKDGALSLEEFCTAMHLVVLRRNNIELPKVLPPSLVPRINKTNEDNGHFMPTQKVPPSESPSLSPTEPVSPLSKEWTRFNESPTSSLSSPGVKPVNFDFQKSAVEQDPKILHPVAVRASPDSQVLLDEKEMSESSSYEPLAEQVRSPTKRLSNSESQEFKSSALGQLAIQRPVPKKPAVPGPGAIPPPPSIQSNATASGDGNSESTANFVPSSFSASSGPFNASASLSQGPKKEPPPPPPPRPKKNHSRSASLDLNRLGAPPAVPPRMSPSTVTPKKLVGQKSVPDVVSAFADFSPFAYEYSAEKVAADFAPFKAGAFEVYKRPESSRASMPNTKSPEATVLNESNLAEKQRDEVVSNDKWPTGGVKPNLDKYGLRSAIRLGREQNLMLTRLNGELNQELLEVMEERIALEIQLEHLKPFPT